MTSKTFLESQINATTILPILISSDISDCLTSFEEFIAYDKTTRSLLFQGSQLILFIAILIPFGKYCSTITHVLLGFGNLIMSAWLYYEPCYRAATSNLMYCTMLLSVANFIRSLLLFYCSFQGTIRRDFRTIYKKLFQPLGVSPATFRTLMSKSRIEQLDDGEQYAVEKLTKIDRLSILISGRIAVSSGGQFLHSIYPSEFLDSPEWESNSVPRKAQNSRNSSITTFSQENHNNYNNITSKQKTVQSAPIHFNISLTATTSSLFVYWDRDALQKLLDKNEQLSALMSVILARDITNKLYQMNSRMSAQKCSEIDIRLPVIITSFKRPNLPQPSLEQNSFENARLKNHSSFGGETSSTSFTVESRSNSVVRKFNDQNQYKLQRKIPKKSDEQQHRAQSQQNHESQQIHFNNDYSYVNNHVLQQQHQHQQQEQQKQKLINHSSSYLTKTRYSQHYSNADYDSRDVTSMPLLATSNGDYSQLIL